MHAGLDRARRKPQFPQPLGARIDNLGKCLIWVFLFLVSPKQS
jgi:hypothetical protein